MEFFSIPRLWQLTLRSQTSPRASCASRTMNCLFQWILTRTIRYKWEYSNLVLLFLWYQTPPTWMPQAVHDTLHTHVKGCVACANSVRLTPTISAISIHIYKYILWDHRIICSHTAEKLIQNMDGQRWFTRFSDASWAFCVENFLQ